MEYYNVAGWKIKTYRAAVNYHPWKDYARSVDHELDARLLSWEMGSVEWSSRREELKELRYFLHRFGDFTFLGQIRIVPKKEKLHAEAIQKYREMRSEFSPQLQDRIDHWVRYPFNPRKLNFIKA